MVRTRVGYAGGTKKGPTYRSLGDHTESIQLDFDPSVISFERLLQVFWDGISSDSPPHSRQYMSILFTHDEEQKRLAEASKKREEEGVKGRVYTEILPAGKFYRAEDYHQKYRLRARPELMGELKAKFASEEEFVDSTAATRINGYLGGHGTVEDLQKDLSGFGLSEAAGKALMEIVNGRTGRKAFP